MAEVECGFIDGPAAKGCELLMITGPTILVDTGFDAAYNPAASHTIPRAAIKGVRALIDTGATDCCIDNEFAQRLSLPMVGQTTIAGPSGPFDANLYGAQIHVPALAWTIYGMFAGVNVTAGYPTHRALIGRTFLRWFTMTYSGPTGRVTLTP